MTPEDYKYRQGRSKRQEECNNKIAAISAGAFLLLITGMLIYNLIKYGI